MDPLHQSIYKDICKIYSDTFKYNKKAQDYLESRGIKKEFAAKYKIGYSPIGHNRQFIYRELARTFQYDPIELLKSNVCKVNLIYGKIQDYFAEDYLIIPCFNGLDVIGFSARTLDDSKEPRYKTLKNGYMPLFNGDILRGGVDQIYLAEGAIDALSLESMGFPTVGILGTQMFGLEHLDFFKDYQGSITIVFDNDDNKAGKKATEKVGKLLFDNLKNDIYYIDLPKINEKSTDINSFLCSRRNRLAAYLDFKELKRQKFIPKVEYHQPKENYQLTERREYDIIDVIRYYGGNLKRESSDRYRMPCILPGHKDTNPSLVVYGESNSYFCFAGCGGGHAINFIQKMENCDLKEAINKAKEICGIKI